MSVPTEPGYYWLKTDKGWSIVEIVSHSEKGRSVRFYGIVDDAVGYLSPASFAMWFADAQWGPRIDPPKEEKR